MTIVVGWRHKRQDKFVTRELPSMNTNRMIAKAAGVQIRLLHQPRQFVATKDRLARSYKVLLDQITIRAILTFARKSMLRSPGASALPRLIAIGVFGLARALPAGHARCARGGWVMYLQNSWYVAAWDHELSDVPLARRLFDRPVVLYRRVDGSPVALEDRCCHRNLPLSMGRIIGDNIQCGYHGLTFEPGGQCIEVPGQSTIPPRAVVQSYPVVERHRWIWIWPGDPARADPGLIPDLFWNDGPEWTIAGDYHHVDGDYRLMIDVQLDATHVTYVHPDTLGSNAIQATPPEVQRDGGRVHINRWLIGVEPPPIWAVAGDFTGLVDRWILSTYEPPTGCLFDIGAAIAGTGAPKGDRSQGITNRTSHFVTPETERSCHYFWVFARNYRINDEELSARMKPGIHQTFREDVEVVEAQQRGVVNPAKPGLVDVNADITTIQARRLLDSLIAAEAKAA